MNAKRKYTTPPHVDEPTLRAQAQRRRQALTAHGCSTYSLGGRLGLPAICCLCCGLGSFSPHDITHRYCGFCREFHSEWEEEVQP